MKVKSSRIANWISLFCLLNILSSTGIAQLARDPTRPVAYQSGDTNVEVDNSSIKVNAIIQGKKRRFALVNGVYLHEGETKDGIEVMTINEEAVMFKNLTTGKYFTVEVFNASIRQPIDKKDVTE